MRRRLLVVAVAVGALVALVAVRELGDGERDEAGGRAASTAVPASVEDAIAAGRAALDGADGRVEAVVSLTSYRAVEGVERIAERGGVPIVAVLVAAPGGPPRLVADRLDEPGEVIYGFTTEAPADVLRDLALRADVRLVDPGGALPLGLRPEETDVVGEPPARPPRP